MRSIGFHSSPFCPVGKWERYTMDYHEIGGLLSRARGFMLLRTFVVLAMSRDACALKQLAPRELLVRAPMPQRTYHHGGPVRVRARLAPSQVAARRKLD